MLTWGGADCHLLEQTITYDKKAELEYSIFIVLKPNNSFLLVFTHLKLRCLRMGNVAGLPRHHTISIEQPPKENLHALKELFEINEVKAIVNGLSHFFHQHGKYQQSKRKKRYPKCHGRHHEHQRARQYRGILPV